MRQSSSESDLITMRKFSLSESLWEVATTVSSLESGYQSLQEHPQAEEKEETKLDLLDSLILEDVRERLQEVTESGPASPAQLKCLTSIVSGMELSSQLHSEPFLNQEIPIALPGRIQSVPSPSVS